MAAFQCEMGECASERAIKAILSKVRIKHTIAIIVLMVNCCCQSIESSKKRRENGRERERDRDGGKKSEYENIFPTFHGDRV